MSQIKISKLQLITQIDELLPQTQCTRCGYPSCHDYAEAIAENKAAINQCPPGGEPGIAKLAALLQLPTLSLNPKHGEFKPRQLAVIEEDACIGCTLCIKACPVDAIVGANKMMHTVIASECTGCDLCIAVCPVDCISLITDPDQDWNESRRKLARSRFDTHQERAIRERNERNKRLAEREVLLKQVSVAKDGAAAGGKSDFITQLMAKVKQEK